MMHALFICFVQYCCVLMAMEKKPISFKQSVRSLLCAATRPQRSVPAQDGSAVYYSSSSVEKKQTTSHAWGWLTPFHGLTCKLGTYFTTSFLFFYFINNKKNYIYIYKCSLSSDGPTCDFMESKL